MISSRNYHLTGRKSWGAKNPWMMERYDDVGYEEHGRPRTDHWSIPTLLTMEEEEEDLTYWRTEVMTIAIWQWELFCRSISPSENERRVTQILQDTVLLICALTTATTTFNCPITLPRTGRPSAWTSANGSISDSDDVTTGWRNMLAVVRRGHGRAVQKPEDDEDVEENEMWGIEPSQNRRFHRRKWRGRDRGRERGWGRRNKLDYVIA